jgi:hypothetical protein
MGADEPGFDVAEKDVDDQEEFASVGRRVLDHRRMLQMLAEIGVATAIAGKPISQQVRPAARLALRKAPSSAPVAAGSTAMRTPPAKKPC